ncbi:MAG TPA: patatin-like phospholipase family protein, partial [Pyrinomonadaceae bacterium]
MPSSPSIPLFEVLEEEYVNLHSQTLGAVEVELVDPSGHGTRTITSDQDWKFHATHFKDVKRFAHELLLYAESERVATSVARSNGKDVKAPSSKRRVSQSYGVACTPDWAKQNLVRYLVSEEQADPLGLEALRELKEHGEEANEALEKLTKSLNARLLDTKLYSSDRFPWHWLYTASRTLVAQYHSGEVFKDEGLERFNRLLLEDAFPQFIERINNIRLAAMYKRFHDVNQSALCLSGGGIRSGTFALGILQGLARHDLLKEFHYLSTVSGGGYIGGWLTAWIHRHDKGLAGVTRDLANRKPRTKIDPDPSPIRYLRRYSNFITPKVGLLTADTWTFLGIYLRNLFLNWLVFIPILLGLLTLPRLLVAVLLIQPPDFRILSTFGSLIYFPNLSLRHIFLAVGFALGGWSLAYVMFSRPALRDELQQSSRFWHFRASQRGFLTYCLLPLLASGLCLSIYWAWKTRGETPSTAVMAFFGGVFTFFAWITAGFVIGRLFRPKSWKYSHVSALLGLLVSGALAGSLIATASKFLYFVEPTAEAGRLLWRGWADWKMEIYACVGVPLFLLLVGLGLTIFVGLSSAGGVSGEQGGIDDEDREWWARASAWLVIAITGWIAVTVIVIFGPIALLKAPEWIVSLGGISGLLTILLGRSSLTPATTSSATAKTKTGLLTSLLANRILPVLALIFLLAFFASLSLATTAVFPTFAKYAQEKIGVNARGWTNIPTDRALEVEAAAIYPSISEQDRYLRAKLAHMNVVHHTHYLFVFVLGGLLFLFGLSLSLLIKLNIFSLHGGYRNRLIRAFLGASRRGQDRKPNP